MLVEAAPDAEATDKFGYRCDEIGTSPRWHIFFYTCLDLYFMEACQTSPRTFGTSRQCTTTMRS